MTADSREQLIIKSKHTWPEHFSTAFYFIKTVHILIRYQIIDNLAIRSGKLSLLYNKSKHLITLEKPIKVIKGCPIKMSIKRSLEWNKECLTIAGHSVGAESSAFSSKVISKREFPVKIEQNIRECSMMCIDLKIFVNKN